MFIIFLDPDPFPSVLGSIRYPNEHNKFTGRKNLTKYAFWWDPGGPTDKENQDKMFRIRIKQSDPDPYQIEKQDPDPVLYQTEKQDPYQKGLDPHRCLAVPTVRYKNLGFKFNTLRDSRKRFLASGFWQELTLGTPESQKLVSNSVEMYLQGYQTLWKFIQRGIRPAEIYSEGSDIFQKLFTRDLIPRRILFWEVS